MKQALHITLSFLILVISASERCGPGFVLCGNTDCCEAGTTCEITVLPGKQKQGNCVSPLPDCTEPTGQLVSNTGLKGHLSATPCADFAGLEQCDVDLAILYPVYVTTSEFVSDACPASCNPECAVVTQAPRFPLPAPGLPGLLPGGYPGVPGMGPTGAMHPKMIDCEKIFSPAVCAENFGCNWYPLDNRGMGKCNDYSEDKTFPMGIPGMGPNSYSSGPLPRVDSTMSTYIMMKGGDNMKDLCKVNPAQCMNVMGAGVPPPGSNIMLASDLVSQKREWLKKKQETCVTADETACAIEPACEWQSESCVAQKIELPEMLVMKTLILESTPEDNQSAEDASPQNKFISTPRLFFGCGFLGGLIVALSFIYFKKSVSLPDSNYHLDLSA